MKIFQFTSHSKFINYKNIAEKSQTPAKVDLRLNCSDGTDTYSKEDVSNVATNSEFYINYDNWKQETFAMSVNNFDNIYFRFIVNKGKDYLPFIYKDLKNGDTSLIHAIELICPNDVPYKGFVSLKVARKLWLKTLKKQYKL